MFSAFQLGFKNFIYFSSFSSRTRGFRTKALVPLRVRVMASKRRLSSSSISDSSIEEEKLDKKLKRGGGEKNKQVEAKKDNKAKGLFSSGQDAEDDVCKGVTSDSGKINAMTVQQLRAALRSAGVPAKGCKSDLVSALKSYLDKKLDGENSCLADDQVSSIAAESILLTRKTNKLNDEDHVEDSSTALEASIVEQNKRTVIQSSVDNKVVKVDTNIGIKKQKLSVKNIDSEKKSSRTITKASLTIDGKETDIRVKVSENQCEPWTIFAHKKPQKGWIAYNPKVMRPPPLTEDTKSVKLMSWNVNGLRALLKLEGFSALELAERENFDVLCLQETKLQEKDVGSIKESLINGYESSFWTCSVAKLGYSGTAIISRIKPLSVTYGLGISDHDSEGRLVTAEFDTFYLICAYVPNSGDGLRRLPYRIAEWDISLSNYIKELEKSKPVILTGDLNCAHEEIDIYNPAGNRRSAGFTNEERQSFGTNFLSKGFVDTFRKQHPNVFGYTYWGYRHGGRKTNKGWRLDYFLVSESIADKVHDSYILPDVVGSDHCPIGLVLKA